MKSAPAGRTKRLLASIIDGFLLCPLILLFKSCIETIYTKNFAVYQNLSEYIWDLIYSPKNNIKIALGVLFINMLFYAFFESSKYQATPGKKIMNLYVATASNMKVSFFRSAYRFIL